MKYNKKKTSVGLTSPRISLLKFSIYSSSHIKKLVCKDKVCKITKMLMNVYNVVIWEVRQAIVRSGI